MARIDPRAPVLVGAAAIQQRVEAPGDALEAVELMRDALRTAVPPAVVEAADVVIVPKGTWSYRDPGRLLAPGARTVLAEIGVLQQTALTRACAAIATGDADVVIVAGGETKYRALRATITGGSNDEVVQDADVAPDELLRPADDLLHVLELSRELGWPVRQYAVMEVALRAAAGWSVADHRDDLNRLWSRFGAVAAANPNAWRRDGVSAAELEAAPMLAEPYTKLHASQWNVDQAAALVLCSADAADRFGIARDEWVFAQCAAESNVMVPLMQRGELHRNQPVGVVGERLFELAGTDADGIAHLELYSCFPSAVRVQGAEMGIDLDREITVTGGMSFAGGPLNNFVLQALTTMVDVLRADPGALGMVTSVSGMLTKFGGGVWGCTPPPNGYRADDVTDEARAQLPVVGTVDEHEGPATINGYTVTHDRGEPLAAVAIVNTPDGARTVVRSDDAAVMASMATEEWCGRSVDVRGERFSA